MEIAVCSKKRKNMVGDFCTPHAREIRPQRHFPAPKALSELKLLLFVGNVTETWIRGVSSDSRLAVSILIITWVSSIVSSCVDNIPFTTVMVRDKKASSLTYGNRRK